jgi:hypothetical protein
VLRFLAGDTTVAHHGGKKLFSLFCDLFLGVLVGDALFLSQLSTKASVLGT